MRELRSQVGKSTHVFLRLSTVASEPGAVDAERDTRKGAAAKYATCLLPRGCD